jgi:hypothetical protein
VSATSGGEVVEQAADWDRLLVDYLAYDLLLSVVRPKESVARR